MGSVPLSLCSRKSILTLALKIDPSTARILCTDFRNLLNERGSFDKIVSLEMAEVSLFRHSSQLL